jgi:hypothetical protein
MARHIHVHLYDCSLAPSGTTDAYDPGEHPRGEHPRNEGGTFVQGSHPGERSERQKRERTDLVANQE